MPRILNVEGLTVDQVNEQLALGAKFVVFEYCLSAVLFTIKRASDVYFIRPGESTRKYSQSHTLLTCFMGWWGIPFGPIYSIMALVTNSNGGIDVTQDVLNYFNQQPSRMPEPADLAQPPKEVSPWD